MYVLYDKVLLLKVWLYLKEWYFFKKGDILLLLLLAYKLAKDLW